MAVYQIIFAELLDNYAVVQTLTNPEIQAGESIVVASVSATFDGTQTVYAMPQYKFIGVDTEGDLLFDYNVPIPNQVLYYFAGTDTERYAVIPQGTLTHTQDCTWITAADIEAYLTVPLLGSGDQTFLVQCASAANNFCFRRRQESGYTDQLGSSPGGDVTLGTIMYASALFRQKGSIDQFASFTDMGSAPVVGLSGIVKQLLGISRPQVA